MGEAIEVALDLVEQRKQIIRSYGIQPYRPWVFLITDGAPTDEWHNAALRIKQEEAAKLILFFAVGVQGADMQRLGQIAGQNPPALLNGLDFRDLFKWLSTSLKRVSSGKVGESVALPPMNWGQITT